MWQQTVLFVLCVVVVTKFCAAAVGNEIDCCQCGSMYPTNIPAGVKHQILPSPFTIKVADTPQQTYTLGLDVNGRYCKSLWQYETLVLLNNRHLLFYSTK